MTGYITKDEALAEKIICSTCADNKQRKYIYCEKCTRCSDFLKGLAKGRKELEKAKENYTKVYLQGDMSLDTEEKYFAYTKGYCKGHTDGLAEGRKE